MATTIGGEPLLPARDAILTVVVSALVTHLIFNRWETKAIPAVITLLVLVPVSLSILLVPHYGVVQGAALSLATYLLSLLSSILIYRLSPFHPLARYPGPLLCKCSKLWMVWIIRGGKQHIYIQKIHEKYGDAVRVGPNEISIRDPSAILPMMGAQGIPKGPGWVGRSFHHPIPALIAFRDSTEHARRRKPWNRAFNTTAIKEYQPIISKRVTQLVDRLAEQKGTVDLAKWISFFTYDFMGDMVYGGGTEMLRDGDKDGLWKALKDGLDIAQVYEHVPWLSYYTRHIPNASTELKQFRAMALNRTIERYKNGAMTKDLFYYLSNEDNAEKESPQPAVVISDGILALVAGSDTTAAVLSNTFWCLIRQPDAYKRLQAEVDQYYPRGEDSLDPKHHVKMVYLDAVLNEAMRLCPVVPSGSQRSPSPGKGDKVIGPYYLPQGNQARIHFWSLHRDPRNFSHPNSFYPDRWLIAEGLQASSEELTHNPKAFIPFSFGPANCVGKNLALQEMRVLICHVVQKLSMRFPEGWNPQEWEEELEDRFVVKMGRLPVIIERRD